MFSEIRKTRSGSWANITYGSEVIKSFFPASLSPFPQVEINRFYRLLEEANRNLGRLDGITSIMPDHKFFIYMYVRKEALLSSQIEGTQSSFFNLLLFENREPPIEPSNYGVHEVSSYVTALNHGLKRIKNDGAPISLGLIREIHKILLKNTRGGETNPGEFRQTQNWIGGSHPGTAIFVPPPPGYVPNLMLDLEKSIHTNAQDVPVLVKAGLIHAQFETIHPFLDGNGRLGRLLITLLLCAQGILNEPLLYLSLYLKTYRQQYYYLLQQVRETGDWESWLEFFLKAIVDTSAQAAETVRKILRLFELHHRQIENLDRPAASIFRVYESLRAQPVISIPDVAQKLQLSQPTTAKAIGHLQDLGILREVTGKGRGRIFVYEDYMNILSQGTEPIR